MGHGGDTGTGIAIVDVGHPVAADGDTRLPVRYTLVASNSVAARMSNSLLALELSLFDPSYNYIAVEMNQDVVWQFVCCASHSSGMSKNEFDNIDRNRVAHVETKAALLILAMDGQLEGLSGRPSFGDPGFEKAVRALVARLDDVTFVVRPRNFFGKTGTHVGPGAHRLLYTS